jgi:hypothetical protein
VRGERGITLPETFFFFAVKPRTWIAVQEDCRAGGGEQLLNPDTPLWREAPDIHDLKKRCVEGLCEV